MSHYSIWIVSPDGYPHTRCFEEVALALREAFAVLGYDAPIVTDPAAVRERAIVLGANVLAASVELPSGSIIYNLEQIQRDSPWLTGGYPTHLRRYPVWDYSPRNIEQLKALGVQRVALCGVGYTPGLTRIPPAAEDIDVLFVGSLNERRCCVIDELREMGMAVTTAFNVYGEERDALVARAKIVLNFHLYSAKVFEIVRVSYMLANRKCVVSEPGRDPFIEAPLKDGVAFASYDDLADTCARLLDDPGERARLASRGFDAIRALSQVPMLRRALAATD